MTMMKDSKKYCTILNDNDQNKFTYKNRKILLFWNLLVPYIFGICYFPLFIYTEQIILDGFLLLYYSKVSVISSFYDLSSCHKYYRL